MGPQAWRNQQVSKKSFLVMHRVNRLHTQEEGFGQRTPQFEIQLGAGRYSNLPGVGERLLSAADLAPLHNYQTGEKREPGRRFSI
jgi:hypothetical protein